MRLSVLLLLQLLSSCASFNVQQSDLVQQQTRPPPPFENLFINPVVIDPVDEIFKLTELQKREFFRFYNSLTNQRLSPTKRIVLYLQGHLKTFNYHSDTLLASQTLAENRGNCLSLAILTRALANIGDVDVGYQLVDTPSIYLRDGGIILSSRHVRSILYNSGHAVSESSFVLNRNYVIIDFFPTKRTRILRRIKENEFFSMYYLNRAAEALTVGDLELAYWLTRKSLDLKPDDGQAINVMAVIHERMGRSEAADKLYQYGLEYGQEKAELLTNYHLFLQNHQRFDEAKKIALELKEYDSGNPFKYIYQADKFFIAKNYKSALSYYKRAAQVADYLDEAYAGIAKSQYMLGDNKRALRSLKKAIKRSQREKTTALYQAKYELLKKRL